MTSHRGPHHLQLSWPTSPGHCGTEARLGLLMQRPPHRKRESSLQEDRGSFVTTPTAELSSQEETLLGSFLDWSLDHCSGYEGDQESEGEKEGEGECREAFHSHRR